MIDLTTACTATATLLDGVADHQLDARTPCETLTVRELVAHVGGLAVAFAAAARKDFGELTDTPPGDGGYVLDDDWRTQYPTNLAALADAWRDARAWEGMTRVGGIELPGEVAGWVGLTEVVIHGWDLARATGQAYDVDDDVAEAVRAHLAGFTADGPVEGLFAAAVPISDDEPTLDRAIAFSGREPGWAAD